MNTPRTAFRTLTATVLATLAVPAIAVAEEEVIPPGNSAVNQYTEALPTPGGHRNTEKQTGKKHRSPGQALGQRNADRLESKGSDGRAAAAAAAATAPTTNAPSTPVEEEVKDEEEEVVAGGGADSKRGGGSSPGGGTSQAVGAARPVRPASVEVNVDQPSGSGGLGEVLGEMTGASSTGQTGWLLPLLIVAIALWALAYATRQRRRTS
jgi:hypothetical protein